MARVFAVSFNHPTGGHIPIGRMIPGENRVIRDADGATLFQIWNKKKKPLTTRGACEC